MIVKNLTKNTVISFDLKEAKTLLDQAFGLLKKSNPRSLLFKTRFGIHTFGLKKPIDILVLDKNYRVVKSTQVLQNSLFFWNPLYNLIIELPAGTIKKSKTKTEDIIKIL